jgi:acyl dehydratase
MALREIAEPNLTALFGRAALAYVRPGRRPGELPTDGVARSGVIVEPTGPAAYDRVCGFRLTDELPVTYPHVLVFGLQVAIMTGADFPFPMVGLVHVANRITQRRPLRAGEPLVLSAAAANLRPHERGTQFDLVSGVHADGESVWQETSTYLRRGGEHGGGEHSAEHHERGERAPSAPVRRPAAVWRVPADIGRRYADVSGDRNPIHLHPLTARLFGFRRAIAHGMWSMSRCLAFFEGRLPAACSVDVRFKLPILLPATVALTTRVDRFELSDRRTGRPHLEGRISLP